MSRNYQFQVNYTLSWDKSDDDNERDPFTYRYAKVRRPRRRVRLLRPRPAAPAERASSLEGAGQSQLQLPLRLPLGAAATRSPRPAVSDAIFGPSRPHPRRRQHHAAQPGRKDNEFSSLDLRLSRDFDLGRVSVGADPRVFNLFNSRTSSSRANEPDLQLRRHGRRAASATRARCSSASGCSGDAMGPAARPAPYLAESSLRRRSGSSPVLRQGFLRKRGQVLNCAQGRRRARFKT